MAGHPSVNARAVRPQQVVIAQTSKHTRTHARARTRTYPHAHAHAALVLHADEQIARAFLLTRLPAAPSAAPSATPSATPSVGFLPAHSMGARQTAHTLEPGATVAVRMLVTVGLVVRFLACKLCCGRGGGRSAPRRPSRPADRPAGAAVLAPPVTFRGDGSDPTRPDPGLAPGGSTAR
jgi:hypothetical protein